MRQESSHVIDGARNMTAGTPAERRMKERFDHVRLIQTMLRHDIINNLNVIGSALNLYRNSKEKELLEEASDRVKKSYELISRMTHLEDRIASHQGLRSYRAAEVCERVLKKYRLLSYTVDGDGAVLADEAFDSIVDNIVSNALTHGKAERIDVTIHQEADFCRIEIADRGSGIPDALRERVFDKGVTGGARGHSGLGLFIVKNMMECYGGDVSIEENDPQGTVVILTMRIPR